jgi:hypothetical protein
MVPTFYLLLLFMFTGLNLEITRGILSDRLNIL